MFLDRLAQMPDATIGAVCESAGIPKATYQQWRVRDKDFKAKVDLLRAGQARQAGEPGKNMGGGFAEFRDRYFPLEYPTPAFHMDIIRVLETAPPMSISLVLVPPNFGKALALDTPIPTPTGWSTIADLKVGDLVISDQGDPIPVVAKSPVFYDHDCYRVTFSGGESVIADADHLWLTETRRPQHGRSVKTTRDIHATQTVHGRPNHRIPVAAPLNLPDAELPVDPYVLGAWLGDGHTDAGRITTADPQIIDDCWLAGYKMGAVHNITYSLLGLQADLRRLGVLGSKHIPAQYLRGSEKQRWALLQGLMDTDGTCSKRFGHCEYTTVLFHLAEQVTELGRSLGLKVHLAEGRSMLDGRDCGPKYRVTFTAHDQPVFRLARKQSLLPAHRHRDRSHYQVIKSVTPVPSCPTQCITVPGGLFLAGQFAVTHNSTLLEDWTNYKLAKDPNHRITIASKSQQQARKMLGRIGRRMTDVNQFPDYISRYGPFHVDGQEKMGKPWTRDYFTVARADHDERDFSLQVLGWSGQVYGSRIDTLILDDIQTRDNLSSVEEMLNKLSLEFLTRGDRNFRTVIIGTRIEVGDIYEKMIEYGVITDGQLYQMPAVRLDENGEEYSLWPERWPMHILRTVRRNVREKAWWCGFMMAPQRGGQATFPDDLLARASNKTRPFGPLRPPHLPDNTPHLPTVLALDPALGGGNALVAASYTMTKMYWLDCVREVGLARTEDILLRIEEFARAYRPQDLIIENVAFQRGLARDDRLQGLASRYGFTVHEHATNRNKQDPILGVGSMAGSYVRGEMDIPDADDFTRARFQEFVNEHLAWRPDVPTRLIVQDLVMAAWFAWLFWQNRRASLGASTSDWNRGGLNGYTTYRPVTGRSGNAGYL